VNKPLPFEIATEISMIRTIWAGPIMLVESDGDCRIYEKVLEERDWRLIPSGGWEAVLASLDQVSVRGIDGVVGVVDRDYRVAVGRLQERANLFCTDKHDLEMMMYESEAFEAVIKECGSLSKLSSWPDGIPGVRKYLYQQARPIAYVRLINEANSCGYSFEKMNFDHFVERGDVSLAIEKFIQYLRDRWPQNVAVSIRDYEIGQILAVSYSIDEDEMVCCGHDISEILSIGLRSAWGTSPAKAVSAEVLERMLRLAYSREHYLRTALSEKIRGWQELFMGGPQ
jgi:hypothetical protein